MIKQPLALLIALCWTLISCNHSAPSPSPAKETPKALQEKPALSEISLSKRGPQDLVESLYQEQVDKNPMLKALETDIGQMPEKKADSIRPFNEYDEGNGAYYGSADRLITGIRDSILREKIKMVLANSESAYKNKTVRYKDLLSILDTRSASLADLHLVLKVARTIPIIERYQNDHLPTTLPLQHVINQYNKVIRQTDSAAKE